MSLAHSLALTFSNCVYSVLASHLPSQRNVSPAPSLTTISDCHTGSAGPTARFSQRKFKILEQKDVVVFVVVVVVVVVVV